MPVSLRAGSVADGCPPLSILPPSHSTPKTLLMSWDGGCKVSRIWNHRHLCLIALSPLSENCPQAWFPFCSYILAWLECLPSPLAQRRRNKLQTIWSRRLDEMLLDLIKPHFVSQRKPNLLTILLHGYGKPLSKKMFILGLIQTWRGILKQKSGHLPVGHPFMFAYVFMRKNIEI